MVQRMLERSTSPIPIPTAQSLVAVPSPSRHSLAPTRLDRSGGPFDFGEPADSRRCQTHNLPPSSSDFSSLQTARARQLFDNVVVIGVSDRRFDAGGPGRRSPGGPRKTGCTLANLGIAGKAPIIPGSECGPFSTWGMKRVRRFSDRWLRVARDVKCSVRSEGGDGRKIRDLKTTRTTRILFAPRDKRSFFWEEETKN